MQDVKVVVVERNIDNIAVEMILEAMKQGQPVVVYGTGTSMEPTICRGMRLQLYRVRISELATLS